MNKTILLLIALLTATHFVSQGQIKIDEDVLSEGQESFKVITPKATYVYQKEAGGFSSIIDNNGNDWVSFQRDPWGKYPTSAASSFRGLPNLIWKGENDGAGHPGHKKCSSWVKDNKIFSETLDKKWKWSWAFYQDHALLEVIEFDASRNYWFLYEGTPGGRFNMEKTYYGSNKSGRKEETPDYYTNDLYLDTMRWMYVGNKSANQVLYLVHLTSDQNIDLISYLGNNGDLSKSTDGMTVFGFGRNAEPEPLLKGKNKFIIGFHPGIEDESEHDSFEQFIQKKFYSNEK